MAQYIEDVQHRAVYERAVKGVAIVRRSIFPQIVGEQARRLPLPRRPAHGRRVGQVEGGGQVSSPIDPADRRVEPDQIMVISQRRLVLQEQGGLEIFLEGLGGRNVEALKQAVVERPPRGEIILIGRGHKEIEDEPDLTFLERDRR
ncbi:hypothetical protein LGR54_23605 [Ancylobacter sp. Lp-2]|uniref:hypothetical protein n=1 Tax=Ancylobacter sp. Lp-2 TaxID=2881339 RepID=UPI001E3510E3|nr:hypothetical protein [Ancylobacter sp. Lp-2]MCB4771601.1 hypothetical protein [Ancylobacter sp. Lp-2]